MNKFLRSSCLVALVLLTAFSASAQSTRKLMKSGNKFYENENYRAALPFYEQVLAKEPDNADALFKAGVSYMSFDKEKASEYVYKAQRIKPKVSKDIEYWLGRIDHINYNFDRAIEHYKAYDATLKKKKDERKEEVAMLIQHSQNAKREFANPKDVFVKNMGPVINSAYSEHSPVISSSDSILIFTSRSADVTGGKTAADGEYYEDIFESRRLGPDEWEKPRSLSGRLNSKGHDASIQIFDNDTKLLFYRQENNGDFYYVERDQNGEWGNPKPLSALNTKGYEADAYITPDGSRIYFATSNYSENGDLDLYYADRAGSGWGKPVSMGNSINTKYDENSPYLSRDGMTLYFSSRGHNTMGGYDIFMSKFDPVAKKWSKPVNMGYPINTPDDDIYYRLSPDGSYAYLSSYRIGGYGEKDIYTINFIRNVTVKGTVYSLRDSTAIPGVELVFSGTQADRKAISYRDVTRPDSGTYAVNILSGRTYQVALSKDGSQITTEEFEVPVVTNDTTVIVKDFYIPYEDTTAVRRFAFNKIYFDTDKYNLRPESVKELDNIAKILKENPGMNISIEGHCDSRASDEYNMKLGANRANSAYQYLRKKGIAEGRMVKVSYGERRPVAENDSPENMQLNRRTEFIVIPRRDQDTNMNQRGTQQNRGARGTTTEQSQQKLQPGTQQNLNQGTSTTPQPGKTKVKTGDSKMKMEVEKDGDMKMKYEDKQQETKMKMENGQTPKIKSETK